MNTTNRTINIPVAYDDKSRRARLSRARSELLEEALRHKWDGYPFTVTLSERIEDYDSDVIVVKMRVSVEDADPAAIFNARNNLYEAAVRELERLGGK